MNVGKTLFAQAMEFVPWTSFGRIVERYRGNARVRRLPCTEHFRAMAFAQLTWRESLRDLELIRRWHSMGSGRPSAIPSICGAFATGAELGRSFTYVTNNTALPALSIAALYKSRRQVELFFKWIKQNLRIKKFFGTSENAVKTQIWCAIATYVLIAIIKKELGLRLPLSTILHIFSVSVILSQS